MDFEKARQHLTRVHTPEFPENWGAEALATRESESKLKDFMASHIRTAIRDAMNAHSLQRTSSSASERMVAPEKLWDYFDQVLPSMTLPEIIIFYTQLRGDFPSHMRPSENELLQRFTQLSGIYHALTSGARTLPIHKTGSLLRVLTFKDSVFFAHTMEPKRVRLWHEALTQVPAALIRKVVPSTRGRLRVFADFGGIDSGYLTKILQTALQEAPYAKIEALFQEISNQKAAVIAHLIRAGIAHMHPHPGNFVVSFVGRNSLERLAEMHALPPFTEFGLPNPKIVNNPRLMTQLNVSYVPSQALSGTDTPLPIVRIMDFDEAEDVADLSMKGRLDTERLHYLQPEESARVRQLLAVEK